MALYSPSRSSAGRGLAILLAAGGVVAVGGGLAVPAVAAPASTAVHGQRFLAAPFVFTLVQGNPDFGFQKAGTVITRDFGIVNEGDDSITIDPAPLTALTSPLAASTFSFSKTTVIPKNGIASFRITFTVPAAGTVVNTPVTLTATDQTDNSTKTLPITFSATSTATDPIHFTAVTTSGASVAFGSVLPGSTAKNTVKITVDGATPLRFSVNDISLVDTAGNRLPDVNVTASSFGTTGATTISGGTATFELTYSPTVVGALSGSMIITGIPLGGATDASNTRVSLPITGAAGVTPTTPPATTAPPTTATPNPATPGATGKATTGVTGRTGGGGSTGSLAETGLPALGLVGFAGLLATGGLTAFVTMRRRAAGRK